MTMALSVLALASCSSKYEYDGAGQWNANDGYAQAQFSKTSITVELAPTDPTQTTIELKRLNTTGSAVVNFDIETNTDNVFTVSPATFADGEETATAVVSFPNAEVGKQYTLKLAITDPNIVSQYSASNGCTLNVMRVKWNLLGKGSYIDYFMFGEKDDPTVEIYQRDDKPTQYRIVNPYGGIDPSNYTPDGNQSEYLVFDILQTGETHYDVEITKENLVYFSPVNTGYFHSSYGADIKLYHPSEFSSLSTEADWEYNKVLSYQADGKTPGQVQLAPYYYMDGVGGWNKTTEDGYVIITFPGYTPPYQVDIANDFAWEEILFQGMFTSEKLGTSTEGVAIYKGAEIEEIKAAFGDCYERFYAQNGDPYCIASPYAEGYNLYFAVNADGKIVIPSGFEDQPIGLDAMGDDIYAHINGGASSFSESEIVLNITFQNKAGDVVYGETNETLANIKWNLVGTGTYTYTGAFADEDEEGNPVPIVDEGYEVFQREDMPEVFKITNWGYGVDFIWTWNQENNSCILPSQFTGASYGNYGPIYVSDLPNYNEKYTYEDYPCSYDPETSTFVFTNIYYVSAGYLSLSQETLKVDWTTSEATLRAKARAAKVKKTVRPMTVKSNMKKQNRLVPQRTTPQDIRTLNKGAIENPGALREM